MERRTTPLLVSLVTALLLAVATPVDANHPNGDPNGTNNTTVWGHEYLGKLFCTNNGQTASTPDIPYLIVGWNDHGHVNAYIDVESQSGLGCMGRISVTAIEWFGGGTDYDHANVPCLAITNEPCEATHSFAFDRAVHGVYFRFTYCIEVSLDAGLTWSAPSGGAACEQFWFCDPPLVEGRVGGDEDGILGGTSLTFAGMRVI